jgi:hypothetical protein
VKAAFRKAPAPTSTSGAVPAALRERRRKSAETRLRAAMEARTNGHVPKDLAGRLEGLVAGWAAHGFEDGFAGAESFEKECYEAAELADAGDAPRRFAVLETQYRGRVEAEHGKIELRGLQLSERVYQKLDVAYVPLRIQDDSSEGEVIKTEGGGEIRFQPHLSVEEIVTRHDRVVVVGAPGSGKSTIMACLATWAATGKVGKKERLVPFVVPVRSLGGEVLDEDSIAGTVRDIEADLVRHVLGEKRALVLVDGLDEAHVGPEKLIPAIQAFAKAHPGNRVVVTSRPAGGLEKHVEIPGFVTMTLLPMEAADVDTFIDRWCLAAEQSIQKNDVRAHVDAKRAADDLKARVQDTGAVKKLAKTPLLCSVICVAHRFMGHKIPERRAALYEVCTNVLLYEWDRTKFPEGAAIGRFDAQQKRFLLGGLAYWMHGRKVAEAPESEVIKIFAERLPEIGGKAEDAGEMIRQIQERSGVLVERRPGYYAFSHLALQEFMTAIELARTKKEKTLVEYYQDPWWHEVIVIIVGVPGADAAGVVRGLLEQDPENKTASAATFLAAECAEAAVYLGRELRGDVEERLARALPPRDLDEVDRLVALGSTAAPVVFQSIQRSSDAKGKAMLAVTLGRMGYSYAARVLGTMLGSEEMVDYFEGYVGNAQFTWRGPHNLGEAIAVALFDLALDRDGMHSTIEEMLSAAPRMTLKLLLRASAWTTEDADVRAAVGADAVQYLAQVLAQ